MFSGLRKKYKLRVQRKLEEAVVAYFQRHPEVKLVVVTGSVGKTSTKTAIATMLSQRYRVRLHEGNHNTEMSVPLAILGIPYPDDVRSFGAWQKVLSQAQARVLAPTDVDVIVQELGTDHPGEIAAFGRYLQPYISVVTAVTPEHMEFFQTIEAVAQEELTAANFSQIALINRDDIDGRFAEYITNRNLHTYGTGEGAEYRFARSGFSVQDGHHGVFTAPEVAGTVEASIKVLGEHNLRPAVAAAAVGVKFSLSATELKSGLEKIEPVPGRMKLFKGFNNSMIIDDTYNSSPAAAESAVKTFLSIQAPHRIVIMGSMNELGAVSQTEHEKIGRMFRPDTVEWVITIGEEAEKYLAPAAKSMGCQVKTFRNAVQAGAFAHGVMQTGSLVLVKGSQGDVYAEEAVKVLLASPQQDMHKLVRQSPGWMAHKEEFFERYLN